MPTTLIFGASRGLGRAFTYHALRQAIRVEGSELPSSKGVL